MYELSQADLDACHWAGSGGRKREREIELEDFISQGSQFRFI